MNPKKTLIFAVVLAVLAAGYFLWDRPARQKKEAQSMEGEKVFTIAWDAIDKIELKRGPETVAFAKKDGEWYMTAPVADEADHWAVQSLISAFEHGTPVRKLEQLPKDYAKTFGLDQPTVIATFTAGQDKKTVLIGHMNAVGDTIYVQPQGAKVVYLLPQASVAALEKGADEMRRRELLAPRDPDKKISKVLIEAVGQPALTLLPKPPAKPAPAQGQPTPEAAPEPLPEDLPWAIDSLTGPVADTETMKQILDKISTLRATEFVKNPSSELATYGLNEPTMIITATYGEGEKAVTKKLTVGNKQEGANSWYVMAEGRPYVMAVDDASLKVLRVTRADLRDHRLLPDLEAAKVSTIDLQMGDVSIRISRSGDGWKLADGTPANSAMIENLLEAAAKWRAEELVDGPRAVTLAGRAEGPKMITLTLSNAQGQVIRRLRFSEALDPNAAEPAAVKPKKSKKVTPTPEATPAPAPNEASRRVVVLIEGGYEGTVYLAEPSMRDDLPTDPAHLRAPQPAASPTPAPAGAATPAPAPAANPPPVGGDEE